MTPPSLQKKIAARLAAVQALYLYNMGEDTADDIVVAFVSGTLGGEGLEENITTGEERYVKLSDFDAPMFKSLFMFAVKNQAMIKDILFAALDQNQWPKDRLEQVLSAILEIGIGELFADTTTDRAVIINEYINLARSFYEDGPEVGLTNVVMDKAAKAMDAAAKDIKA